MEIKEQLEYAILHANVTQEEVIQHCIKAKENNVYGVCLPPYHIALAKDHLEDTDVKIITVCGYPFGYSHTAAKVEDIKRSLGMGADEIDLVPNFAAIKSQDWKTVQNDISSAATLCQMQDKVCKVIVEVSLLTKEEMLQLIEICESSEVNYIKTGTGMLGTDVNKDEIAFLKANTKLKIKAAGGIKSKIRANQLIEAGADRIGSSKLIK